MRMLSEPRAGSLRAMARASTQMTATATAALRRQALHGLPPHLYPRPDMEATPAPADGSSSPARPRVATPKSDDSGSVKSVASALPMDESTPYAVMARTEMVHRVLEGLRDEAFELARDIGIESLTEPGGLRTFITQMRNVVFPRAAEEARELVRVNDTVFSHVKAASRCCRTSAGDDAGGSC